MSTNDHEAIQRERAVGAYALLIDVAPESEADWKKLRRTLRLPRADAEWLRTRVPGAIRHGARVDLQAPLEALLAAGFAARIAPR